MQNDNNPDEGLELNVHPFPEITVVCAYQLSYVVMV